MKGTWEVIWYDAAADAWHRPGRVHPTRQAAELAAASHVLPTYVRSTRDLDIGGLPEGPPGERKRR